MYGAPGSTASGQAARSTLTELIDAHRWHSTPLGPRERWPQSLRSALSICLGSSFPTAIYWGEELTLLYNDAWAPIPADRHPWALGRPGAEVWADIWDIVGPQFDRVMRTGEGFAAYDQLLMMERGGVATETWWNYSFTPIVGEDGRVTGILNQGNETTDRVLGERRAALLLELGDRMRAAAEPDAIAAVAAEVVGRHLGVDRIGYASVAENGSAALNAPDWTASGVASARGVHRLADFGEGFAADLRAGRLVAVEDVALDARTSRALGAFARLEISALAVAPICEAGRFAAALFAHSAEPRRWSPSELKLIEEAAERVWAAVERARVEAAARESERRLKSVLDSVSDGFYALDRDWRFTLFNSAAERYFGRPRDEVVGRVLWDVFPEVVGTEFERRYRSVMEGGGPVTFETRSVACPDRVVEMRVAPKTGGGVAVSFSNVTERHLQAREIEQSRRLLDAVLDALPVGVIIADASGAITRTNPANSALWGEAPPTDGVEQYGEWKGWWPETGERVQAHEWAMARVLERGETVPGELVEIERFDVSGRRFMINTAAPVRDEDGRVVAGLVAQVDVTERVLAQRELADALAAKDVLLHEVNHRVKNSLQIVTSLLMLQMGQAKDPALRAALNEARTRIGVVAAMHQRLYSTSEHDRVDFGDYLRDMATETLQSLDLDGRIALEVDLEHGVVLLLTHAVPLALVVSELVTNAVKYAFPDGRTGRLRVALRRQVDGLGIEVTDDGVGLPAAFDPARSGGLGMRIVTALVRQVRGTLAIERAEPGARFRIAVPGALTMVK